MHNLVFIGREPRIAVEHCGRGPLVVFLHGIGGNRTNWRRQLDALEAGFHAAAWDARGYGDSDDYEGALRFEQFSDDLVRVLDHFAAERAHLVGLSMGGRIALDFCGRHPSRVASLVLADTSGGMPDGPDKLQKIEAALRDRKRPLLDGRSPEEVAAVLAPTLVSPAATAAVLDEARRSLAAVRTASYLKTLDEVTRYDDFPPFETIRVPTLVLSGEHDRVAPPEYGRWVASRIPGARFALVEGAGHLSNIEQPDTFNAHLTTFLRDVRAGASKEAAA